MLLAQISSDSAVNLVSNGAAIGVLWFMLRWFTTRHEQTLDALTSGLRVNSAAIVALQKELLAHDLTSRNLPDAADDEDLKQRLDKAFEMYSSTQNSLSDIQGELLNNNQK